MAKTIKRNDPPSVRADGYRAFGQVRNVPEDREIRWVREQGNTEFDLEAHLADGWEIEVKRPGGPETVLSMRAQEGTPIRQLEYVLVSKDRALVEERDLEIRRLTNEREKQIIKKTIPDDPMRGTPSGFSGRNETEALRPEWR